MKFLLFISASARQNKFQQKNHYFPLVFQKSATLFGFCDSTGDLRIAAPVHSSGGRSSRTRPSSSSPETCDPREFRAPVTRDFQLPRYASSCRAWPRHARVNAVWCVEISRSLVVLVDYETLGGSFRCLQPRRVGMVCRVGFGFWDLRFRWLFDSSWVGRVWFFWRFGSIRGDWAWLALPYQFKLIAARLQFFFFGYRLVSRNAYEVMNVSDNSCISSSIDTISSCRDNLFSYLVSADGKGEPC